MIRFIIYLYILVIIAAAILSYFPAYRKYDWARYIDKLANYSLNPVKKLLPPDLPFDISPIIVIVGLQLIMKLW